MSTAVAGVAGVRTSISHRFVPSQGMFGWSHPMKASVLPSGESRGQAMKWECVDSTFVVPCLVSRNDERDRKSTRLNSSHVAISYAVFCLKKKNNTLTVFCIHDREVTHAYMY